MTPPSINGLKSLCALGITLSDSTLTMAVLQELFSQGDSSAQVDVSHLMTISHCLLEVRGEIKLSSGKDVKFGKM